MLRRCPAFVASIAVVGLVTWGTAPLRGAAPVVVIAGTTWDASVIGKIKVKGASGSFGDLGRVFFGLNQDQGLADNGFLLWQQDGPSIHGTYVADSKGKITVTCNPAELEDAITDMLEDLAASEGVAFHLTSFTLTSQKTSGKVSKGVLKLKTTAKFEVTGTADGETYSSKGSLTVTLVGD